MTVNVVDAEDTGTVTLSQRQPQIGRTVIASLTDPDGGVTVEVGVELGDNLTAVGGNGGVRGDFDGRHER